MAGPVMRGNPDEKTPQTRSERGACHDCDCWGKCLFHLKRLGGFKGQIPRGQRRKNIGYRLITDGAENYGAKEDYTVCQAFVEVLQDRMLTGQRLRSEGKEGEFVSVIAQEGEVINQRFDVGFNARNQVIRAQPSIIAALEEAGYKVNLDDRSPAVEFRPVTIKVTVPPYREPMAISNEYTLDLLAKEKQRLSAEEEMADEAWKRARARHAAADAKPAEKSEKVATAERVGKSQ